MLEISWHVPWKSKNPLKNLINILKISCKNPQKFRFLGIKKILEKWRKILWNLFIFKFKYGNIFFIFQILLCMSWHSQRIQQIRCRPQQIHQTVSGHEQCNQKRLRHWCRLRTLLRSGNLLPPRVRQSGFHRTHFRDCGYSGAKLSHWCQTRPL